MYWQDLLERTLSTFAQGVLGVLAVDQFSSYNADWQEMVYVGAAAGVFAVLKGLAAKRVGSSDNASFIGE